MIDTAAPATPQAAPSLSAWRRTRAILGGAAGNLVEWYDWFAYAAFSIYFAKVFFPKGDPTAQLMQTAAIFAVGFGARPVGAWLMGLYADRKGRKAALTLAVGLMCLGSLVIALCPGHAAIGNAAPVILLLARLLQGLSVGGEYGASATYMSEMAGRKRRGFWSSFQYVTLIMGQLVAALVLVVLQNTLDKSQLDAWGWRIPFLVGAALAVVVFWIRTGIEESVSHQQSARPEPVSSRQLASVGGLLLGAVAAMIVGFTAWPIAGPAQYGAVALLVLTYVALAAPLVSRHPRPTLAIIGLTAAGSLAFYAYTTYMLKFLTNTAGFSKATAGAVNLATLAGFMLIQPLFGWLSDKVGPQDPAGLRLRRRGSDRLAGIQPDRQDRQPAGRLRPDLRRPGRAVGLHRDQRRGEGRAVPHPCPGPGRGPALRHRQRRVRRHGGICRPVVQARGNGERLLPLSVGDDGRWPGRGPAAARHRQAQPDPRGLIPRHPFHRLSFQT
jgi:MHS family alpha-ketoglutarate permease-like MFS transporter